MQLPPAKPAIPESLLDACPEPELAQSGEVAELLRVHVANTAKAGVCRQRHAALVQVIEESD